jgi:hypothetical protein
MEPAVSTDMNATTTQQGRQNKGAENEQHGLAQFYCDAVLRMACLEPCKHEYGPISAALRAPIEVQRRDRRNG